MTPGSPSIRDRMAIRVEGLSKAFQQGSMTTTVLDKVNLAVEPGRCIFLAGPSGSGKTTLLSILGCILTADVGRVEILGQDLAAVSTADRTKLRRDKIGFVFQRFHLIHGLTALDNVCVPMTIRGTSPSEARRRALEVLAAVGLENKAGSQPRKPKRRPMPASRPCTRPGQRPSDHPSGRTHRRPRCPKRPGGDGPPPRRSHGRG